MARHRISPLLTCGLLHSAGLSYSVFGQLVSVRFFVGSSAADHLSEQIAIVIGVTGHLLADLKQYF